MHWQSTQVTVGAVNSRQRAPWPHRAQGGTGLHWSLLCQRSSKNLQPGHLPAVFTTLSSKLKESEVKGSREENVLNVNLKTVCWDSAPEMGFKSQRCGQVPLDLGDSLKRWEEHSRESWALRLRHCRAQRPSLHPSNHAACFYSRDATGQWHKMALQNFPNFTSGPKSTTVRFKLHWKAYDSRFQRI